MHKRLFIIGVVVFTVSFLLPIGKGGLGFNLAFVVFEMSYSHLDMESLLNIFLLTITNIAALCILFSYFKVYSRIITALGVLGTLTALYWLTVLFIDNSLSFLPFATMGWTAGIFLLTTGYELKRRSIKRTEHLPSV